MQTAPLAPRPQDPLNWKAWWVQGQAWHVGGWPGGCSGRFGWPSRSRSGLLQAWVVCMGCSRGRGRGGCCVCVCVERGWVRWDDCKVVTSGQGPVDQGRPLVDRSLVVKVTRESFLVSFSVAFLGRTLTKVIALSLVHTGAGQWATVTAHYREHKWRLPKRLCPQSRCQPCSSDM